MSKKLSGPEAKKFITALKDFISSIVGTPARTETEPIIRVALDESDEVSTGIHNSTADDASDEETDGSLSSSEYTSSESGDESKELKMSVPEPTFHEKVLRELHHRVFNRMPIRLLKFVQNGPDLEISLIERAAIYRHLVSALQAWDDDGEYKCTVRRFHYLQTPRLETEEEAISRILEKYAGYAILSHTWLRDSPEVTYGNWKAGLSDSRGPGYRKLVNFCKVAHEAHGLTLGWMDTVCINKDSSSELDESIRSMYDWYERCKVCIVYLAETASLETMHRDPWFTRGWTLQELLAPEELKFYNNLWKPLSNSNNDKERDSITIKIRKATTISSSEHSNIQEYVPISRRMQLAAPRNVTREEDAAYSLMGLFDVSIATAYGEGSERAFYRLLQEILNSNTNGILDLFNWAGRNRSSISQILPKTPQEYLARNSAANLRFYEPIEPLTLTHMGIRIPLLLMSGSSIQGDSAPKPLGDYSAVVSISPMEECDHIPTVYNLLLQLESHPDDKPNVVHWDDSEPYQFTFAVFNVGKAGKDIIIPSTCIALLLACDEDAGMVSSTTPCKRIYTEEPVVFDMLKRNPKRRSRSAEDYMVKVEEREIKIPEHDLAKHGMQLVFKYL